MDLSKFIYLETLESNPTEKALFLLGKVKGQQQKGEAILILNAKIPTINQTLQPFTQVFPFTSIKEIFQNDIYAKYQTQFQSNFEIQSIFPITQKQKLKYQKKIKTIHKETGKEYESKREQLLKQELGHIGWVRNIIEGKAEQERVLYQDQDIVLLPDFKFHDLKDVSSLHLLCIFKSPQLHSIRDLTQDEIGLLEKTESIISEQLKTHFQSNVQYQFTIENCRSFFHYPPTFYQLHLHIQSLQLDTKTCNVERCHQLSTVIENIKIKGNYYQEVTLNCFKEENKKV